MNNGWISVKDRMPEVGQCVDIWSTYHGRLANYRYVKNVGGKKGNNFFEPVNSGVCCVRDATHWMPLPPPPEGMES